MQVILLERVENLGGLGDEVSVKNGFARNFLLPKGKALIANTQNRARFEAERDALEKRNAEAREAAQTSGQSLDGTTFILIRQSGATGQNQMPQRLATLQAGQTLQSGTFIQIQRHQGVGQDRNFAKNGAIRSMQFL